MVQDSQLIDSESRVKQKEARAGWGSQEFDPLNRPVVNGGGRFGTLGYPGSGTGSQLERRIELLSFPTPWGSEVDDS